MYQTSENRSGYLVLIAIAAVIAVIGIVVLWPRPSNVVVTHWANGHMMNTALLPRFAKEFNEAGHHTASGAGIEVKLATTNSGVIVDELTSRIKGGSAIDSKLVNPTIVTPAANHWLSQLNYNVGSTVVDSSKSQTLAITWVGIATYREMAQCLGWPSKAIGIADVVALQANPKGWASCPTAKTEWGQWPLLSFTDPTSSSTARSMLFALYSIAAHKDPEQLTAADVIDSKVVDYIKAFQRAVDHYVPDTLILNSKIYNGPRYGHFFFVSESNLVQLYQGKIAVTVGAAAKPQPLSRPMVMIYPKEGSVAHNHLATIVQASWVTPEQVEAAQQWIAFLREEPQQRAFMEEGFRPATGIALGAPITPQFGLDPTKPTAILNPDSMDPEAANAIVQSWDEVKKPGVVTFVADISGSMSGSKIDQAKKGLVKALDAMSQRNSVGLLSFSSVIHDRIEVAPLSENRFRLAETVNAMQVKGGTALYDAIKVAIEMTDAAPGDEEAIRGVVVLTDGQANEGQTKLSDLITMIDRGEEPIKEFTGMSGATAVTISGRRVDKKDLIGTGLALNTKHPIHVFFVGVGDADLEICRLLAEATNSACQGTTDQDLGKVIETFGKYF